MCFSKMRLAISGPRQCNFFALVALSCSAIGSTKPRFFSAGSLDYEDVCVTFFRLLLLGGT